MSYKKNLKKKYSPMILIQQGTQAAILEIVTPSTSNLFILFIGTL